MKVVKNLSIYDLKDICHKWVDKHTGNIEQKRLKLLSIPELGYKEIKTSSYIYDQLQKFCKPEYIRRNIGLTGIKATVPCGNPDGINICLICELDAVITPKHPNADSSSGAAHSCGHHMQMTTMLAAFEAIVSTDIIKNLFGRVTFMAIPAEEYVELEYRKKLKEEGEIRYFSGKQEFIYLGEFDDVDMAVMVHAHPDSKAGDVYINGGSLGFTAKTVEFLGKAAHAGASPDMGINALNAATAAMMCIHMNRETFRDEDHVRIHPIITKGGDLVNIIPDKVSLETYVRAKTLSAMENAACKVDRSIRGACIAIGAKALVYNFPGYLPLVQDNALSTLVESNVLRLPEFKTLYDKVDMPGSSDIGDLSYIMPVIQPTIGGFEGEAHAVNFLETDPVTSNSLAIKLVVDTVIDVLAEGSKEGKRVKKNFIAKLSKKDYLDYLDMQEKSYYLE